MPCLHLSNLVVCFDKGNNDHFDFGDDKANNFIDTQWNVKPADIKDNCWWIAWIEFILIINQFVQVTVQERDSFMYKLPLSLPFLVGEPCTKKTETIIVAEIGGHEA